MMDLELKTKTEIKKYIYKEQPKAYLEFIRIGVMYYYTTILGTKLQFEVPINDMGSADFFPTMEAKYLLRWLISGE